MILDVRDLWPDLYLDAAPKWLRAASHVLLKPYFGMTKFAFSNASAIVGISERYLEWDLRTPEDLGSHETESSPSDTQLQI